MNVGNERGGWMEDGMLGEHRTVAVLGLGLMGSALARVLLAEGRTVMVWNRTPEKGLALAESGATVVSTPAEATAAAPLIVVCVSTYAVVEEVLDASGGELAGRVVVNLTSGTPEDARAMAAHVAGLGGTYIDGAILATPDMVGTEYAFLLYSGAVEAFEYHEPVLRCFGAASYLGEDAGLAAAYDLGLLTMMYATQAGFLYGLALARAQGVEAATFLPFATSWMESVASFMPGLAEEVDSGEYATTIATLAVDAAALDHIVEASQDANLDVATLATIRDLARRGIEAGHGDDSFGAVFELIRG